MIFGTEPWYWTGWAVIAVVGALFFLNGIFLAIGGHRQTASVRRMMEGGGFKVEQAVDAGWACVIASVLYTIPATSLLGAILLTGFMGGAMCSHFQRGEPLWAPSQIISWVLGLLIWLGLYLRDPVLRRMLLPFDL